MMQPAPAPRFSRTEPEVAFAAHALGVDTQAVLADWGFTPDAIGQLREQGALT